MGNHQLGLEVQLGLEWGLSEVVVSFMIEDFIKLRVVIVRLERAY